MNTWTKEEIRKAAKIMLYAERKKSTPIRILDEVSHWLVILVSIFGLVTIDFFMILLLEILPGSVLISLTALLGLILGFMIRLPLFEIEKLHIHKHFLARTIIPAFGFLNIFIAVGINYLFSSLIPLQAEKLIVMALVLETSFILPLAIKK